MLRIVLPVIAGPIRDVLAVGVSYEVVVVIDGDIVVAAPPAVVSPTAAPGRAHGNPDAEGNCHTRGVVPGWRISNWRVGIRRRAVHDGGVITGHVDHFWVGLLNYDDVLAFKLLRLDLLLL